MSHFFAVNTRRLAAFLGVFFISVLVAACSPQTPESVAKDYIKAVADNRIDEAVEYFSLENVKENDLTMVKNMKFHMIVGEQYSRIQSNGGMESVSASLVDRKDNLARVDVEIKHKNGKTRNDTLHLIQESGKWKVRLK